MRLIELLKCLSILIATANALATTPQTAKVAVDAFLHQGQSYLAVGLRPKKGWHTYWKNPGDSGQATEITITGPKTAPMPWPIPSIKRESTNSGTSSVTTYVYDREVVYFFAIKQKSLQATKISILVKWLACKQICIPGQAEITGSWHMDKLYNLSPPNPFSITATLEERFANLPRVSKWPDHLTSKLQLTSLNPPILQIVYEDTIDDSFLLPFNHDLLTFKAQDSPSSQRHPPIMAEWDGEFASPPLQLTNNGILPKDLELRFLYQAPSRGIRSIINKTFNKFTMAEESPSDRQANTPTSVTTFNSSLIFYLLLAFVGGLILNIMPCVLPVISLKLFNLLTHADESPRMIFKHNAYYTLGVMSVFWMMGITIIILQSTLSLVINWGFHLQSPTFIFIMITILFILGLNLFGLFEFTTPGGKTLGNIQLKKGVMGDFVGGMLATILATPCSAPFLGTALTFAFGHSPLMIMMIFTSAGLGMSVPFIITALFPATISFIPTPGPWIENAKKILGLTIMITVIWLIDVLMALTVDSSSIVYTLSLLLFLFFAFYSNSMIKSKSWKLISWFIPILILIRGHHPYCIK